MATYPKITGNSVSTLDRVTSTNNTTVQPGANTTFLTKKIVGADGHELSFGLVIIENNGDAGTLVRLDKIAIRNSGFVELTNNATVADQEALFVANPLQRTDASTYTATEPFMGNVDASSSYAVSNQHTQVLNDANTETGLSALTSANRFCQLGVDSTDGRVVWLANDNKEFTTDANAYTVKGYVPIYDLDSLQGEDNVLQSGEYAAFLIKADARATTFDGQQTYSLEINHNANSAGSAAGNQNFLISLTVTGQNDIIWGVSINGSSTASGDSSAAIYSRMNHTEVNPWTGFSWPALSSYFPDFLTDGDDINPPTNWQGADFTAGLANMAVDAYMSGSEWQDLGAQHRSGLFGSHQTAFKNMFYSAQDISAVPEAVVISHALEGGGGTYDNSLFATGNYTPAVNYAGTEFEISALGDVKTNIRSSDVMTQSLQQTTDSTILSGTYATTSGVYKNFALADITNTASLIQYVEGTDEALITHYIRIPYGVYPLYTYPEDTIDLIAEDAGNSIATSTSGVSTELGFEGYHEHTLDTFESFTASGSGSYASTPQEPTEITSTHSTGTIPYNDLMYITHWHNVRINALTGSDDMTVNGLIGDYAGYGATDVRTAVDADTLNTSGASTAEDDVATTKISSAASIDDRYRDYTIEKVDIAPGEVGSTAGGYTFNVSARAADGTYKEVYDHRGFVQSSTSFFAPVTCWKPGYDGSINYGDETVGYFNTEGASYKTLTLKNGFYVARPHLCWGYLITPAAPSATVGEELLNSFEFLAPLNYTSTAVDPQDGIYAYEVSGTEFEKHTKLIRQARIISGENFIEFTSANHSTAPASSVVAGMQIYDTTYFPEGTVIESFVVGTADTDTNRTRIIMSDNAIASGGDMTTGIQLPLGKPRRANAYRNTSFAHTADADQGFYKERDRVNSPYGLDLSWAIMDTKPQYVTGGDLVHITNYDSGFPLEMTNIQSGSITTENDIFVANASGVEADATSLNAVNIYNFNPTEVGIQVGGSPKPSRRSMGTNGTYDLSQGARMMTAFLGSPQFSVDTYSQQLTFNLFNAGFEDCFVAHVETFDPYYIPAGAYSVSPPDATNVVWSIEASQEVSGTSVTYTVESPLSSTEQTPQNPIRRLQHQTVDSTSSGGDFASARENELTVSFSVDSANSAGDYYQAVEVAYYRDIAATQMYQASDGQWTLREFGNRPLWKSRFLIKIKINSVGLVTISDADETAIPILGSMNFGTIIA